MAYSCEQIKQYIDSVIAVYSTISIMDGIMKKIGEDYNDRLKDLKSKYGKPPVKPREPVYYKPNVAKAKTFFGQQKIRSEAIQEYAEEMKKYRQKLAEYQVKIEEYESRNNSYNLPEQFVGELDNYKKGYKYVNEQKKEAEKIYEKLMELDIINEKYRRNIEAMICFKGYFDDELVTYLAGPGGAYVRYEDDLRIKVLQKEISKINKEVSANNKLMNKTMAKMQDTASAIISKQNLSNEILKGISLDASLVSWDTNMMVIEQFWGGR